MRAGLSSYAGDQDDAGAQQKDMQIEEVPSTVAAELGEVHDDGAGGFGTDVGALTRP